MLSVGVIDHEAQGPDLKIRNKSKPTDSWTQDCLIANSVSDQEKHQTWESCQEVASAPSSSTATRRYQDPARWDEEIWLFHFFERR